MINKIIHRTNKNCIMLHFMFDIWKANGLILKADLICNVKRSHILSEENKTAIV